MKRSLSGLVVAVALSLFACSEEPRGKLEPIPRPPGMQNAPKEPEAAAPAPEKPAADANKVTLRWKVAPGAPVSYRLSLEGGARSAATEPEPEKPAKGKKGKAGKAEPAAKPVAVVKTPGAFTFVVERTDSGDFRVRVLPEGGGMAADEGAVSERGFVLDGLQGSTRNLATLVLELPRDPVGAGDTWALGTELVAPDALAAGSFQRTNEERRNRVKLVSLTPGEGGEQVATLEYDISENLTGKVGPALRTPKETPHKDGDEEESSDNAKPPPAGDASAEVKFSGRGEFLVKAGHWRSWEGDLSTVTKGRFPATAVQVPPGALKLRLTPREAPPAAPAPAAPAPAPTATPQQ